MACRCYRSDEHSSFLAARESSWSHANIDQEFEGGRTWRTKSSVLDEVEIKSTTFHKCSAMFCFSPGWEHGMGGVGSWHVVDPEEKSRRKHSIESPLVAFYRNNFGWNFRIKTKWMLLSRTVMTTVMTVTHCLGTRASTLICPRQDFIRFLIGAKKTELMWKRFSWTVVTLSHRGSVGWSDVRTADQHMWTCGFFSAALRSVKNRPF